MEKYLQVYEFGIYPKTENIYVNVYITSLNYVNSSANEYYSTLFYEKCFYNKWK